MEKSVNSLAVDKDIDSYFTESNDNLLSSELSTLIAGRYVEIKMSSLLFKEFLDFQKLGQEPSLYEKFDSYLTYSSKPPFSSLLIDRLVITNFLREIYNMVIPRDSIQRNVARNVLLLESELRYLMQNLGTLFSTRKSVRLVLLGMNMGILIENIVYLEILRRNLEVFVSEIDPTEITFTANRHDIHLYVPIITFLSEASIIIEKLASRKKVNGPSKKLILTFNREITHAFEE